MAADQCGGEALNSAQRQGNYNNYFSSMSNGKLGPLIEKPQPMERPDPRRDCVCLPVYQAVVEGRRGLIRPRRRERGRKEGRKEGGAD